MRQLGLVTCVVLLSLALYISSAVSGPIASPLSTKALHVKGTRACKCGYTLSQHNGLYLRDRLHLDFRTVNSLSKLQAAGLSISDGWQMGVTGPDGTQAWADPKNIKFGRDGMQLIVPGKQGKGGKVTGAEVTFANKERGMTKIVAHAMIQVDATPGTCQSLFTYSNNEDKWGDEQDMEIIAASLLKESSVAPPGLQLTNYAPDKSGESDFKIVPFKSNPSRGFHKYSLIWDGKSTQYYFDGNALANPKKYSSRNPSVVMLNHWATGDLAFFGADLPQRTVTMRVRSLTVYYETDFASKLPAGCIQSQVCSV